MFFPCPLCPPCSLLYHFLLTLTFIFLFFPSFPFYGFCKISISHCHILPEPHFSRPGFLFVSVSKIPGENNISQFSFLSYFPSSHTSFKFPGTHSVVDVLFSPFRSCSKISSSSLTVTFFSPSYPLCSSFNSSFCQSLKELFFLGSLLASFWFKILRSSAHVHIFYFHLSTEATFTTSSFP